MVAMALAWTVLPIPNDAQTVKMANSMAITDAVFDGEQSFGILGRDTEYSCEPAPEHCTWSPHGDGGGYTDDVSCSDGCRKCGGESTKLRHVSLGLLVCFYGQLEGCPYLALWQVQADGEVNVGAQQEYNHGPSP